MLSRTAFKPRRKNAPRPAEKSAKGFLQWLRGRACIVCNAGCAGNIEAAHVDYAGGKGIGTKVSDRFTVPLCSFHHRMQHSLGWTAFEDQYFGEVGFAVKAAEAYWRNWPGRQAWEAKNNV